MSKGTWWVGTAYCYGAERGCRNSTGGVHVHEVKQRHAKCLADQLKGVDIQPSRLLALLEHKVIKLQELLLLAESHDLPDLLELEPNLGSDVALSEWVEKVECRRSLVMCLQGVAVREEGLLEEREPAGVLSAQFIPLVTASCIHCTEVTEVKIE